MNLRSCVPVLGIYRSDDDSNSSLTKMLKSSPEYLGAYLSSKTVKADRRTIIVVPAYTSRSADYWIYGQSALLAAGLTTVFCAAVSDISKGGSCFIGRSSWNDEKLIPASCFPIQPYSGWSPWHLLHKAYRRIRGKRASTGNRRYRPTVRMNEGRPRPQTLPIPIQLVAHLPIVESVDYAS